MKIIPVVGAAVAGVFLGATIMEIIHRIRPNLVKDLGVTTKKTIRTIGEAFKEGYYGQPAVKTRPRTSG